MTLNSKPELYVKEIKFILIVRRLFSSDIDLILSIFYKNDLCHVYRMYCDRIVIVTCKYISKAVAFSEKSNEMYNILGLFIIDT